MARRQAAIVGAVQEVLRCVEKEVGGVRTIPALAVLFAIPSEVTCSMYRESEVGFQF